MSSLLKLSKHRLIRVGLAVFLSSCVAAWVLGLVTLWATSRWVGSTTDEVKRYLDFRLGYHPRPALILKPLLASYAPVLGIPAGGSMSNIWRTPPLPEIQAAAAQPPTLPPNGINAGDIRVLTVGPHGTYATIGAAAKAATDGAVIEVEPGDYIADTAVFTRQGITVRARVPAATPTVRLVANGASAEGKAIWVVKKGSLVVEGLAFVGSRVKDRNGAGIKLEDATLTVRRCLFHGNENGILTGNFEGAALVVEQSEFGYNGHGDGLSHSLYVGTIASLRVSGSYFHHANGGHHIKSRANYSEVMANRITDESGGRASYEADFPNGGEVIMVGNILQQGEDASHSSIVAYGFEGYGPGPNRLMMLHNTLVNDHPRGGTMVRIAAGDREAFISRNLWVGIGRVQARGTPVKEIGNLQATRSDFIRPSRHEYGLRHPDSFQVPPIEGEPQEFLPAIAYRHPLKTSPLVEKPRHAGAPLITP